MNKATKNFEYTCVLTSCNRFDLLEQTLTSLFKYLDILPKEFIIIEDSGQPGLQAVLGKFKFPFTVIINPKNFGQARSIDIAYARVSTEYIFHCEDDWEFLRTGFISDSLTILKQHKNVSAVQLRGRAEQEKLKHLPCKALGDISYFLAEKKTDKRYFSYSYNPSLRRLSDYQKIAPLVKIGGEREVSWVFKKMGFVTAHLEIPAVAHLGETQHIEDQSASKIGFKRQLRSWHNIYKRTIWFFTGFPNSR